MADSAATAVPVKVCGHMGAVLSESDSSSDESSKDDIEVEFGEESADSADDSSRSSTTSNTQVFGNTTQPPAVAEGNGIMVADLPSTSNGSNAHFALGTKAPAIVADRAIVVHRPVDNAFGIAYKPRGTSSKQGYELPTGPAFVDEDEFEQDMGAEFRVVLDSPGVLEPANMSSGMALSKSVSSETGVSVDDFSEGQGNDCQAVENKGMTDWRLQASGSFPSSMQSSSEPCLPDGNSSQPAANDVVAPLSPSHLKLDNQEALISLTEGYRNGSASQNFDLSAENVEARQKESSKVAVVGIPARLGGDVRQYPVMEEEGAEQEEEDESIKVAENLETAVTTEIEGRREEEHEAINNDNEDEASTRARVAREWEAIDQLRTAENSVPMEKGVGGALQPISIGQDNCIVTTEEVLSYFRSQDLVVYKNDIIPFQPPESRFALLRRVPKLKFPDGVQLRDEVFLFTQIKYSPDDVIHRRLIQTIYRRITNEKRTCPDVGPHWDVIGFQGNDPCTDLNRSMGVFALFQVLSLLETQLAFAMVLYRLSIADGTGWPFLCVSIGFTKEAVGVLRRGSCYSECNRRESVLDVVNELHQAQFYGFLELCRREPATHHALHLAKIRERMDTDSRGLVKTYRTYLSEEKARSALGVVEKTGGGPAVRKLVDFPVGKNAEQPRMKLGIVAYRKSNYVTDG
eukprot:g6108.t1